MSFNTSLDCLLDQDVILHLVAQRRSAGKGPWDHRILIKHLLSDDGANCSDNDAAALANQLAVQLRRSVPTDWLDEASESAEDELIEVVDGMEALRPNSYDNDPDMSPLEDLNGMLNQLYDWADKRRVWIG